MKNIKLLALSLVFSLFIFSLSTTFATEIEDTTISIENIDTNASSNENQIYTNINEINFYNKIFIGLNILLLIAFLNIIYQIFRYFKYSKDE